ncbi:GNAT family N-acetyltransferase [Clostridium beijerinckii]|uniref:GNAT family N-acetyltransferase n=1 Tax=Clostridium beijerinckii TaxID=1520 RepID=UPI00232AE77F|nr:GNAT family N-acetyltransferase [Clostridium beijerinckii]
MIFEDKKIKLKNGEECILRSPDVKDAEKLIDYLRKASSETDYMLRYPEEITMTIEDEEKFINDISESNKDVMISAFIYDKLVGNSSICIIGNIIKVSHRANFGIAVIKEAWNLGVGKALLIEILKYAKKVGFEQVELEVASDNYKAINLYEEFGFKKYGTRSNSFKLKDGSYYTEYLMMKNL